MCNNMYNNRLMLVCIPGYTWVFVYISTCVYVVLILNLYEVFKEQFELLFITNRVFVFYV